MYVCHGVRKTSSIQPKQLNTTENDKKDFNRKENSRKKREELKDKKRNYTTSIITDALKFYSIKSIHSAWERFGLLINLEQCAKNYRGLSVLSK